MEGSGLAELAVAYCTPPAKATRAAPPDLESVFSHDDALLGLDVNAFVYTLTSASPNPGPAGAGATIFLPDSVVLDLGASLGHNSNNYAELYAIGICFKELLARFHAFVPPKVII